MIGERFFCPFSTRVGDAGQRYEVWCMDADGVPMKVGWTDTPDGGSLVRVVQLHPRWHTPWVVDRLDLSLDGADLGDVSTHILKSHEVRRPL